MAHVQIRGGVADWYWTADLGSGSEFRVNHAESEFCTNQTRFPWRKSAHGPVTSSYNLPEFFG